MSVKDRIRDLMRKRTPWKDLLAISYKSALYDSWATFQPEAGREYDTKCIELNNIEKKVKETEIKGKKLDVENKRKNNIIKEKEAKVASLEKKEEKLNIKIKEKTDRLKDLSDRYEKLVARGITEKSLSFIEKTDVTSDRQFFDRIKTAITYSTLKDELQAVKVEIKNKSMEVDKKNQEISDAKGDILSLQNELDEFKVEYQDLKNAIYIVHEFLKNDFSIELQLDLLKELKRVAIKKQPEASVRRFLSALREAKKIERLVKTRRELEAETKSLFEKIDEATGTLRNLQENILDPIHEVQDHVINMIKDLNVNFCTSIDAAKLLLENSLEEIEAKSKIKIDQATTSGIDLLNRQEEASRLALNSLYSTVLSALNVYNMEVEKSLKIFEEAGNIKREIRITKTFFEIIEDPNSILTMPTNYVERVIDALDIYLHKYYPDIETKPPRTIAQNEFWLQEYNAVKVTSLTSWLAHVFHGLSRAQLN